MSLQKRDPSEAMPFCSANDSNEAGHLKDMSQGPQHYKNIRPLHSLGKGPQAWKQIFLAGTEALKRSFFSQQVNPQREEAGGFFLKARPGLVSALWRLVPITYQCPDHRKLVA